ncbi:hypothetical protein H9Q10_03355 [Eikenella sp. S3360]|uniref:Lipoprotein n=1 Tax=Eikenella glucosivorans TaxID=2766967 RepID=A0ABS0N8V3_9NEIS|nr:hypothetical protein [Eikenella glucosivorans]MBH5328705.1 hypothetical protein [Eikenella glucosivorans]
MHHKTATPAKPIRAKLMLPILLSLFAIAACTPQTNQSSAETAASQASIPITQQPHLTHAEFSDFRALYLQDYEQSDQIINRKRLSMQKQTIRGFFSSDLNSKFSQGGPELVDLLIVDGVYHLLILAEYDNTFEYTRLYENGVPENLIKTEQASLLVNLETGSVIQDDKTDEMRVYNYLKSAEYIVEVPAITGERKAIFMEQEEPAYYCANKIYRGCHHPIYYDTGYHLGEYRYAFYTSDTSYQSINNKPLYIGFYRYTNNDSKALENTPFLAPETLIINRPVRVKLDQPNTYIDSKHVPADFVGNIRTLWQIDKNRRYLVYFGDRYPFLFLIMDGEKGLNIPENQFDGISFVPYAEAYAKFGQYTDYRKRANDLSDWMNARKER